MTDLAGRVALVTGAASGIGRATAETLAERGALVVVSDVDADGCADVAREIEGRGFAASARVLDVTSSAAVDEVTDEIVGAHGRLDVLVNNAGLLRVPPGTRLRMREWEEHRSSGQAAVSMGTTVRTTDELWRLHMSVMVDGVFFCTRAALRHMEGARRGAIVNVASIGAFTPAPTAPYYAAAKAAVVAFTRSVAHEVAPIGIRVNAVAPGPTATPIMGVAPSGTGTFAADAASGRLADPREIAVVVAFLASDAASYCFGETFTVSGGFR